MVTPSDSHSAFFVTARVNERVSFSITIGLAACACILDDCCVATHRYYFYQAERTRTEEHLTAQLRQKETEVQEQVAQTHQREAELREARTQLQQRDAQLNTIQLNFEVPIINLRNVLLLFRHQSL